MFKKIAIHVIKWAWDMQFVFIAIWAALSGESLLAMALLILDQLCRIRKAIERSK